MGSNVVERGGERAWAMGVALTTGAAQLEDTQGKRPPHPRQRGTPEGLRKRLCQDTGAMWLAGGAQIKAASHAHIDTLPQPHTPTSTPAPSHLHPAKKACVSTCSHAHTCLPPQPTCTPGTWTSLGPGALSQVHLTLRKPRAGGPCSGVSHPGRAACRRPSVFAYNLHVLTQTFPSLHRALPS